MVTIFNRDAEIIHWKKGGPFSNGAGEIGYLCTQNDPCADLTPHTEFLVGQPGFVFLRIFISVLTGSRTALLGFTPGPGQGDWRSVRLMTLSKGGANRGRSPFSVQLPASGVARLSGGSFCFLGPLKSKDDLGGGFCSGGQRPRASVRRLLTQVSQAPEGRGAWRDGGSLLSSAGGHGALASDPSGSSPDAARELQEREPQSPGWGRTLTAGEPGVPAHACGPVPGEAWAAGGVHCPPAPVGLQRPGHGKRARPRGVGACFWAVVPLAGDICPT